MDRNLGAMDTNNPSGGVGSIYYQFGRKDPFEGGSLYKPDGSSISISAIAWNSSAITLESSKKGKNVPYSVQNPLKFITRSSTWTTGDIYCPAGGSDFLWQDPKSVSNADGKVKKSIFDPCPSGWMVPVNGTWNGIQMKFNMILANGIGRYYYPDIANKPDDYAFYPDLGYRDGTTLYDVNGRGYSWSCSSSGESAYYLYYRHDYNDLYTSNISNRAKGYFVRCIQEYF